MDTLRFSTSAPGTSYSLPTYRISGGQLQPTGAVLDITFVRAASPSVAGAAGNEGVLVETLLAMVIADLEHKHALVPAEEGARTLNHLRSALDALNARTYRRQMRGVLGTYEP